MNNLKSKSFRSRGGFELEVLTEIPENPRFCAILWPCMGGAVQMYRLPVDRFIAEECACIQYNPGGHGRSGGNMEIHNALADLDEILSTCISSNIPLIMIGHSAGANAVLQFGMRFRQPRYYVLAAPVLDSRESLFYMYRLGTIREFIDILCSYAKDDALIREVLSDDRWLSADRWNHKLYKELFDRVPARILIGTFLENLFIPGHNAFQELAAAGNRCSILLAPNDTWYPIETTKRLCVTNNIDAHTVVEAANHFFTGGWDRVWDTAIKLIASDMH